MNLNPIGGIIEAVGKVADDLFTSDRERLDAANEAKKLDIEADKVDASLMLGQQEINKVEAASSSLWVSGARPAILWVGAVSLGYQFILYPLMTWGWTLMQARSWVPKELPPPPMLNNESLMVLITSVLGISTSRTIERLKGKVPPGK